MSKSFRCGLVFVVLAVAVCAVAGPPKTTNAAQQTTAVPPPAPVWNFTCVAQGTPVEFPDDIYLRNAGNSKVPKGTMLSWEFPNTGRKGTYVLTQDLAPNSGITVSGVVAGGITAGLKCSVKVMQPAVATAVAKPALAAPIAAGMFSVGCVVQGTPVEFPDDIVLTNNGVATIAIGTKIHWEVPNSGRQGDYTFLAPLAPHASVSVSAVVGGGLPAGTKCNTTKK